MRPLYIILILIPLLIILLFTIGLAFNWFLYSSGFVCWELRIDGYRNTETGECESFSDCWYAEYPEKYVFDEDCWHQAQQIDSLEKMKVYCERICNSTDEKLTMFCGVSHAVKVDNEIIYEYCQNVLA